MRLINTIFCLTIISIFSTNSCLANAGEEPLRQNEESPKTIADEYRIYDGKGQGVTFDQMMKQLLHSQVVFLGESHDDRAAHLLQEKILKAAHHRLDNNPKKIAVSLEMFERDVQHIVDEYLSGLISEKHFLAASRPWKNYEQDYKPLLEFAKKHGLSVIAANAPRRYVSMVGGSGASSLNKIPAPLLRGLPPLPYAKASSAYAAKFKTIMKKMHKKSDKTKNAEETKNPAPKKSLKTKPFDVKKALEAQSLWDAAMAYSIAEFLLRHPQTQVIHLNGSFHSDSRLGIPEHLLRYRPGTTLSVVTIIPDASFPNFDLEKMSGRGDFVVVTKKMKKKEKTK